MKRLTRVLIWIIGIIGVFMLIGAFLPNKVEVSRSITINTSPHAVYGILSDLKTYHSWMPWNQKDPAMKTTWGPKTAGNGAWYSWDSQVKEVGQGKLTIVAAEPDSLVTTSLEFGGFDRPALASWTIHPVGNNSLVNWTINTELGHNPLARWFGLFLDKMIGPDFENGLGQLKTKMENGTLSPMVPKVTLEEQDQPAMQVLTIMDTAKVEAEIGPKLQKAYGEMGQLLQSAQLSMQRAPMAWYYSSAEPYVLEAAVAVDKTPKNTPGRIRFRQVAGGKALVAHYFGPYEESKIAYKQIQDWILAHKATAKGAPYEIYMDDPTTKKSMYEVRTDIVQPLE